MKKIASFIAPILVIAVMAFVMPNLLAGGMNPVMLIVLGAGMILLVAMIRPKSAPKKSTQQVIDEVTDDFCRDAFASNEAQNRKYLSALTDLGNNLPKSAVTKLNKLSEECTAKEQKYAVALAAAKAYRMSQDYKNVIREYNKAIVLNPTDSIAYSIGECNQRLGNLDKARDSYEFAQELDPSNPQYPSSLGTVCVGEGDYETAISYAQDALDLDEAFPQALATMAICYAMKNDSLMHKHYLDKAMNAGYSQQKIDDTVKALKKRK